MASVRWKSAAKRTLGVEIVADGVFYIPRFWEEAGLGSPDATLRRISCMDFPSRAANTSRYRGNEVSRDVVHVNATGDRNLLADYSYTGRHIEQLLLSQDILDVPFLQERLMRINRRLRVNGNICAFNHVIATRYAKEGDRITRHHDNPQAIAPGSFIMCVSFGALRVFSVHAESLVWSKAMDSGSAVIMTADANKKYTHALGEITEGATAGERYSLVFRKIATVESRAVIVKKVHAAQKSKIKAETKRQKRSALYMDYFFSMEHTHPTEVKALRRANKELCVRSMELQDNVVTL